MDAETWLLRFGKLDELITAKEAERQRLRDMACSTVGKLDGMPRATGKADKVGNLSVKLADADAIIKRYEAEKEAKTEILERLPADEYGVLHREYLRGMTQEQIAEDIGYCTVQVWRIKKRAKARLEAILAGSEFPKKERG